MSKSENREQKIRNNPRNVALRDFEALINQYGYIKEGSKHPKAVIGDNVLTYKRSSPVRPVYVRFLLHFIDIL